MRFIGVNLCVISCVSIVCVVCIECYISWFRLLGDIEAGIIVIVTIIIVAICAV